MQEQVEQRRGGQAAGPPPAPAAPAALSSSAPNALFATYEEGFSNGQTTPQEFWSPFNANPFNPLPLGGLRDGQPGISGANPSNLPATTLAPSSCPSPSWHTSFPPTTTVAQKSSLLSIPLTSPLEKHEINAPFTFPNALPLPTNPASDGPPPVSALPNGDGSGNRDGNGLSPAVDDYPAGKVSAEDKEKALNAPPTFSQNHLRPGPARRSPFLAGAPLYQSSLSGPTKGAPPSLPPLTTFNLESSGSSLPAASAIASTNPTAAAFGPAGATGVSIAQNATSSDSPTTFPAPAEAGQQPPVTRPTEGYGGLGTSKPVLKMKRTGQNLPLTSPASLHQRNSSYSPSRKLGPALSNGAARKSFDPVPGKAAGSPLTGRQPSVQTPKPGVEKGVEKDSGVGPFNKPDNPDGTTTAESQPARRFPGAGGPTGLLPKATHVPKPEGNGSTRTVSASNNESDDEIMYETTAAPHDLLAEGAPANDSSSDDSDSETDDDDTMEMDHAGETSFQQLFRAPDQESDDYEEETEEEEATSVSSSEGSSIANEPSVALPSANIQQQEAYPATILTMANPERSYTTWLENGVLLKASPAIFPDGYRKSPEIKGFPWICAVRSCRMTYKTSAGLRNHFRLSHKKARLNDNMDGTLSLVGSYTKKNKLGLYPPVVVSKRPLDPNEPPMVPTTRPDKAQRYMKAGPAYLNLDGEDTPVGNVDTRSVEMQETAPPSSTTDSKSSEEMWEYIRPYLKVHGSLPAKNWSRQVSRLPRVREIKWNEERNIGHPFKDSYPRDVTALIIQVTGVESPTTCDFCAQGRGPFVGCIMISPEASSEARASVLSCANCYYQCRQSTCSLCSDAVARRERGARTQQQPKSYNVKRLSDTAHRRRAAYGTAQTHASLQTKSAALQASSRPTIIKLYEPSEINNIEMADKSRTYKVIKGKNGENILMHGALIPEHYDLDRTIPGYPWICPVRSCRFVFKRIANLGSHFVMKHRGCLFNDNRDGTLSLAGYYNKPLAGEKTVPALIISQKPLDKTEPPIVPASLPGSAALEKETRPKTGPKIVSNRSAALPQPGGNITLSLTGDAKRLWGYMLGFLPKSPSSLVSDPQTARLFSLPRRRSIHWRATWDRRRLDDDRYQILGLLLYLIGEEYERGCTNCRRHQGPFHGCFLLPREADYDLHQFVKSCANCHFTHNKQACSAKSGLGGRVSDQSRLDVPAAPPAAPPAAERAVNANKKRRLSNSDAENDEALAFRQRFDRFFEGDSRDTDESRRKIVPLSLHPKDDRSTLSSDGAMLRRTTTAGGPSSAAASSVLINAGQVQPDDVLEMEDWEIAPGRICETGAARIENIAFSKSYLETNQAVQVSPDVHFEVKTIRSGNSLQLEADSTKARYCSLASGKLRIRIDEQPEFTIGPHGMFKIKPGLKACVQNRLYIDSVLHIVSHKDY